MLAWTVSIYSLGSLVCGLAPSVWVFVAGRAIVGLGVGGEWAIGHGMLAEAVPPERRGRWSAALQSGEPLGVAMAAIVGYLVLPRRRLAVGPHRLERNGAHRARRPPVGAPAERALARRGERARAPPGAGRAPPRRRVAPRRLQARHVLDLLHVAAELPPRDAPADREVARRGCSPRRPGSSSGC